MAPPNRDGVDGLTRRLLPALLVSIVLFGACSDSNSGDEAADSTSDTTTTTTPTTVAETSATSGEADDADLGTTPVRNGLDWVVDVLNSGGEVTTVDAEERFTADFLAEFPAELLTELTAQVFAVAEPPYVVETVEADDDGLFAEAVLLASDDQRLSVQISVEAAAPNLIEGLGIVPVEPEFPAVDDVESIDIQLAELGPQSSLGIYDVTSGECVAVHELRTDTKIVLASVFKLWVLAALAHEIDEGRASWDETLPVIDRLRSSPDGEIFELETGSEVSLQRLAEAMISISDNTATDMLIDRLGRQAVETAQGRAGVADPAANLPLLSTGNLFTLKFAPEEPNAVDYRALDEAGRRSMLDELDLAIPPWVGLGLSPEELFESTNADGIPFSEPRDLDIEWFATADDLCSTLVHLDELAETAGLEPVADILEASEGGGLPFDRNRWPTIRFKGGSEPGVVAGAWWFEGPDGDRYVLAGGVVNPDDAFDTLDAVLTLSSAIELIE